MTDQQRVRGGDGRYLRTLEGAERQARAAELRSQGLSYRKIAAAMADEGSASALYNVKTAFDDVRTAMAAVVQESAEAAVQFELDRLDAELVRLNSLYGEVEAAMGREHATVSQGKVVTTDDGATVPDDEFLLKCVDRLTRIDEQRRRNGESRRRLLGLDQPAKSQVSGGLTYEVVGIDPETLR
ncbi:hypothetical protein [Kitasatospora cineracea]|uniref:hypothetical protein n=1 Tax=Kitasatospora cineracea TaxID=88074 RepID=UPI0036CEF557